MKSFRWFPALAGGFLAGFAIYMLISMLAGTPQSWAFFAGWILCGWWAGVGQRHAWGRIWLTLCIASFAMPVASLVLGAHATSSAVNSATSSAEQAGAIIGGAIGTTTLAGFMAFIGFFLGIIFAILAYFGLRTPRHSPAE